MKHSFKDYVLATRPWSFPASAMPVVVTLACMFAVKGSINWWMGLWTLLTIVVVHAAGNTWSDYFDYKKKVDRPDAFAVPTLVCGQFQLKEIMRLSLFLQTIALLSGVGLVLATGLPLLWIGLAGIALSLLYPPLKYMALGDVVIYFCYAFLPMLGTSFIVTGVVVWPMLWLSVPVGLITISILHANNTRDIETDGEAHIKTFAMILSRPVAAVLYCAEVIVPFLWMTALVIFGVCPWWTLLVWLVFPMAMKNSVVMMGYKKNGVASFAALDQASAQLQLAFSLLLSIGFILYHFVG